MFAIGKSKKLTKEYEVKIMIWIKNILQMTGVIDCYDGSIQIMISEIECNAPDCVPIETLIIIFGIEETRWTGKILKPINEVSESDVMQLLLSYDILKITTSKPIIASPISIVTKSVTHDNKSISTNDETNSSAMTGNITQLTDHLKSFLEMNQNLNHQQKLKNIESIQNVINLYTAETGLTTSHMMSVDKDKDNNEDDIVKVSMVPHDKNKLQESNLFNNNTSNENHMTNKNIIHDNNTNKTTTTTTVVAPNNNVNNINNYSNTNSTNNMSSMSGLNNNTNSNATYYTNNTASKSRHEKGVRPRGCPCCDPDNIDNIVDKLLYLEAMP